MIVSRQQGDQFKNRRRFGGGMMRPRRKKVCPFCAGKAKLVDYKNSARLQPYISDRGKMEPRRRTGVCAKHQRVVAIAVKRARHLALIPYVPAHILKTGGVGVRE